MTINLLDPSQKQALDGVLNSKEDVAVIYGPPGTGKSHLILSMLFELALRGDKVLFVSQNTEALNVIIRKLRDLNVELGIDGQRELSFLDFCWCLNDPAHRKMAYIKQQKSRIMTRPIKTLPSVGAYLDNDIPYALVYRHLDGELNKQNSEEIGFDELLASSLKNVYHSGLMQDILHTVSDESYREALRLLNDYDDKMNMFVEFNNPRNALKYLDASKTDYSLHDVKMTVNDLDDCIGNGIMDSRSLVVNSDMDLNEYLLNIYQLSEYSKVININKLSESDLKTSDLVKLAKKCLSVDDGMVETVALKIPTSLVKPVLTEKEDTGIRKLNDLGEMNEYRDSLSKIERYLKTLVSTYNVDKDAKFKKLVSCVFSAIDFGVFLADEYIDKKAFRELTYKDLTRILETVDDYNTKGSLKKVFYSFPDDVKILDRYTIETFNEGRAFIIFLKLVLKNTNRKIGDILECKAIRDSSIVSPIDIREYKKDAEKLAKISNTLLTILNAQFDVLNGYTVDELENIISRQIHDMGIVLDAVFNNKKVEFESIEGAIAYINGNIKNNEIAKTHKSLDTELKPYITDVSNLEKCCNRIIELSKSQESLEKILEHISGVKIEKYISIEYINEISDCLIKAKQEGCFSQDFFTIHQGENLITWKKHIDTLIEFNDSEQFEAFVAHNRFINNLRAALSQKNDRIIGAYLKNENITYDVFREQLTYDIVENKISALSGSAKRRIGNNYFKDFKADNKRRRLHDYICGLQTLKLKYEDPAKTLGERYNWVPAGTNIERIRRNSEMIADAFPVTIATPVDVSRYLNDKKATYDYVIFDEASQLLPGQALPSIYRAKKAVIVGDPHQMPPTRTITVSGFYNSSLDDDDGGWGDNEQSILDLAINMQLDATYFLKVHYRSESNILFEPSRSTIYSEYGVESIVEAKSNELPIYIEDNLGEDDEKNFVSIVRRIDYYLNKNKNATFCIIFANKNAFGAFKTYLEKTDNTLIPQLCDEDRVLVSTVTDCQGIEGDHTILYLPHYKSPAAMWYFKAVAGAYKRTNVSITRQRRTIDIIMGNTRGAWLQVCDDFIENPGSNPSQKTSAILLKKLLTGAGQEINVELLDKLLGQNAQKIDSPLTQQLYDRLNEHYKDRLGKDLKIWCEIGDGLLIPDVKTINKFEKNVGYRIDIGIYSIEKKRFVLGIEMDGSTYHSGFSKEFSDLQRQEVLERKGWTLYRIWSTNWLQDTEAEFNDLTETIDELLLKEVDDGDLDSDDEYGLFTRDSDDVFGRTDEELEKLEEIDKEENESENAEAPVKQRSDTKVSSNDFDEELIKLMEERKNSGKPVDMKYSNIDVAIERIPYQSIYIKDVDKKEGFFLGSFSLAGSPYRIKISDVVEYKTDKGEILTRGKSVGLDEQEQLDTKNKVEVKIPDGETVVNKDLLMFYFEHHEGEEINFRYQTSKPNSGKKWRKLILKRYRDNYFWCSDLDGDKVAMYRCDRVLEIKI